MSVLFSRRTGVSTVAAVLVASVVGVTGPAAGSPVAQVHAGAVVATTAGPTDQVEPLSRIKVSADGESLVDSETGKVFVPRGYNYVRLHPLPSNPAGSYQSTFEPGLYDPQRVEAMLTELAGDGYNTVRVFADAGYEPDSDMGQPHGLGHGDDDHSTGNSEYLDNMADFVRRAASHGVYVLPSLDLFPFNAYYKNIVGAFDPNELNIANRNLVYMFEGYVRAKEEFLSAFTTEMAERLGPLMSTFLALQPDNEMHFNAAYKPFDRMTGTVTGLDGVTYNMADLGDRQRAADNSMLAYAERVAAAVRDVDPEMMVTIGAFTNKALGRNGPNGFADYCVACHPLNYRYPARMSVLSQESSLDFLDVHIYPAPGRFTLQEALNSIEWSEIEGPVINGEFGAVRERYGNDINRAAEAMLQHQLDSCGLGMTGWLFWTWDTDDTEGMRSFFRGNEAGGVINDILAPNRYRPVRLPGTNQCLALKNMHAPRPRP